MKVYHSGEDSKVQLGMKVVRLQEVIQGLWFHYFRHLSKHLFSVLLVSCGTLCLGSP